MKLNKKGFTIVELVIVIAVIAILAAVLIPTFSNVIGKANESSVLQAAKTKFEEAYALDYSDGVIDGKEGTKVITLDADTSYVYDSANKKVTFTYTDSAKGYKATYEFNADGTGNPAWVVAKTSDVSSSSTAG